MLAAALRDATVAHVVAHNASGANLMPGLVEALAAAPDATDAVLETDEGALVHALAELDPDVVVLGELSRDQLDRYHEVRGPGVPLAARARAARARRWSRSRTIRTLRGASRASTTSGGSISKPRRGSTRRRARRARTCSSEASRGHVAMPELRSRAVEARDHDGAARRHGHRRGHDASRSRSGCAGAWQHANAALALTAAHVLGLDLDDALAAMATVREVATPAGSHRARRRSRGRSGAREEPAPAGPRSSPRSRRGRADVAVVIAQNDRTADGTDPSFLWDVPFESFAGRTVAAAGTRAYDVATRLDVAGADVVAVDVDPLRAGARSRLGTAARARGVVHVVLRDARRRTRNGQARIDADAIRR